MRILDLDLDFFLDEIAHWQNGSGRLNDQDFTPWTEEVVRAFLEEQCGLSMANKVRGRFVKHHHEAFYFWRELILAGNLEAPFEVVHVDAHSDTGFGDSGFLYVANNLLHLPPQERINPDQLYAGNYIIKAIACRWVSNIVFVLHPKWNNDIPRFHMKDLKSVSGHTSGQFQLKKYDPTLLNVFTFDQIDDITPLGLEPEVPFSLVEQSRYVEDLPFDYIVLSHSPEYTPPSADALIPIIMEYIDPV